MSGDELAVPSTDVPRFRVVEEDIPCGGPRPGQTRRTYWVIERTDLNVDMAVCECHYRADADRVVEALTAHERVAEAIVST